MKNSKRGIRIVFNSPVILGFVLICFLVTLLNEHTGGRSNQLLFVTYHSSFKDPLTYVRFFTHVFGHSGWDHFLGNMTYILLLGPMLEEKYSSKNILKVFLITALVTALINYIFFPGVGLCGASGIAFALIVMTSFTGFRSGDIPLTFLLVAAVFIGQQVYEGITLQDNISHMAHIVGGIIGAIVGFKWNK